MATTTNEFDAFFRKADLDGDGQISGAEAVAFFQGSGLPKNVLAQVWTFADQRKAGYLGRQEFYNALKLVTVAQSQRELTPEIVKAALYGPAASKIPAPKINIASPSTRLAPAASVRHSHLAPNTAIRPSTLGAQQFVTSPQTQISRPSQFVAPGNVPITHQVIVNPGAYSGTSGNITRSNSIQNSTSTSYASQVQPKLPGQMPDSTAASKQFGIKDTKPEVGSNGFQPDSFFGDVFSATPIPPNQNSTSLSPSDSSLPSSLTVVSAVSQPSTGPTSVVPPQVAVSQARALGTQNPKPGTQNIPFQSSGTTSRGNVSDESRNAWPKIKPSDIQNYMNVFVQVDSDRDGKITGEQARNLFLSWKLPREILKRIWDLSDQDNDSMLSLREFCVAVYLMERHREGRSLPTTLPYSISSDETLLSATSHPPHSLTGGAAGSIRQPHVGPSARPPSGAAPKPPRPPIPIPGDDRSTGVQKIKMPVIEKQFLDQLSEEEQKTLNLKLNEVSEADKKVVELEKEISESKQKIDFYRAKMQELIIYKSRCDNRLNEVSARVSSDRREVESLAMKYEEKCKQTGDVASRLTLEEATFRDVQEKKMDLYRAIVKLDEGNPNAEAAKERVHRIQSGLEELMKTLNERCKQYGLRAVPTSLVELPFGWQPGVQEGAADLNENWDKFDDEGFIIVKELTLDVQNIVASPKKKSSLIRETPTESDSPNEKLPITETQPSDDTVSNGVPSPKEQNVADKDSPSPFRDSTDDASPRDNDQSGVDGRIDFDSLSWKDEMIFEKPMFDIGEFGLNPIKTGLRPFAFDSVPSTPVYDQGRSRYADSVPGTPAYNAGIFADSVPSTPSYGQGKPQYLFADSVPGTPAYGQGKSPFAYTDSVYDTPSYGQGKSPFAFADSVPSTPAYNNSPRRSSDGDFGSAFPYQFESFRENAESEPTRGFSRFDSFGSSDFNGDAFSRFDSFRESDSGGVFPTRFDSFASSKDAGFAAFDSFGGNDFVASSTDVPRFDASSSSRDLENRYSFSSDDADPFGSGGPFKSTAESETPRKAYEKWGF